MKQPDGAESTGSKKQLLHKIVERVFVYDGQVLAVVLYGDFGVVFGKDDVERESIAEALQIIMAPSMSRSQNGSDGRRIIVLHLGITTVHTSPNSRRLLYCPGPFCTIGWQVSRVYNARNYLRESVAA